MTRSEALDIVIRIAARWGENAEERLPRRVRPTDTDEQLAESQCWHRARRLQL
jgi:hypothetical protein